MKKNNLLLALALFASATMSFAQDNLALNGEASSTKGNAKAAIDNDNVTRWEFPGGSITNETDAVWNLDLGSPKEFNTIQILWETAYSEEFNIYASDNADEFGAPILHVTGNKAGLQTYKLDNAVTARYVKFENLKRGTEWGVSFYEFRLFNMGAAVLTSIDLKADQTVVKVNTPVTLTAQGKDQLGGNIDAGEMKYEIIPVENGTITNGVYTPIVAGETKIVAKSGEITSNEITVTAYAGEKIDIFTNMASMVTPLGEETTTGSMVGAFDDNMGSVWELHANTGDDDESRTYKTGFVIDFGALYDITAVSLSFEGAQSQEYTIAFAGQDGVYTTAETYFGQTGILAHNEFYVENSENVRYVKFLSTKAGSQYGVKLFDFSVYGNKRGDLEDTAAPTGVTATLVSTSFSSATLKLQATDDVSSVISYEISYTENGEKTMVTATGASGAETIYTVAGLNANTDYTFSVVAKDAKGNAAAAVEVTAKTTELVAAPVPTADADNVMSIYSDKYGNDEALDTNPNWGQTTINKPIKIGDDNAIMLSNLGYQGMQFTKMDVTEMEKLHIDIYAIDNTALGIVPIWRKADDSENAKEITYKATDLKLNAWNSIDIDLTEFDDVERKNTNIVYQIKFVAENNPTFILDNIYFHKTGVVDGLAPVFAEGYPKAEAALNTVTVTVKGSDDVKKKVTYTVKCGEAEKTVIANNDEEATVVFDNLAAGEYTFTVTASDGKNVSEEKTVKATVKELNKIEINTNRVALDEDVNPNDMPKAFDGDLTTKWQMLPDGKGNLEEGFTVDLRGFYNVDAVAVAFRDAASSTYTVELLDGDKQKVAEKTVTGVTASLNELTETINALEGTEVRYVKYTSKGSTTPDWGVHIAEFTVYGTKTAALPVKAATVELTAPEKVKYVSEAVEIPVEFVVKDAEGNELTAEDYDTVEYDTSDPWTISVTDGKFLAEFTGTATISVTVDGVKGEKTISVERPRPAEFTVTADNTTVEVGQTITLTCSDVKDQFGDAFEYTVEPAYSVDPMNLGNFVDNVFTATEAGTGNIKAFVPGCEEVLIAIEVTYPTGINGINADGTISEGTEAYNLAGQRVSKATKGSVLIVNGKKVIIK